MMKWKNFHRKHEMKWQRLLLMKTNLKPQLELMLFMEKKVTVTKKDAQ